MGKVKYLLLVVFVLSVVLFSGCHHGCKEGTTRCNGTRAEICNTRTDWELEADCSDIEDFEMDIAWMCCFDPSQSLHMCLPAEECERLADGG